MDKNGQKHHDFIIFYQFILKSRGGDAPTAPVGATALVINAKTFQQVNPQQWDNAIWVIQKARENGRLNWKAREFGFKKWEKKKDK